MKKIINLRDRPTALDDEDRQIELRGTLDEIETALQPIVLAHPGYWLLSCYDDLDPSEPDLFDRQPIVAWRWNGARAEPVALHHVAETLGRVPSTAILHPDGEVTAPDEAGEWDDEKAWRAYVQRLRAQARTSG